MKKKLFPKEYIPTKFDKNPNIGRRVTGVEGQTDWRRAKTIGSVDLKIKYGTYSM